MTEDTTAAGVTEPVTLPLLTDVDTDAGYVQPRISWPRPTTAPALEPAWAGEFRSFDDWVSFASKRLTDAGRTDGRYAAAIPSVCIDAKGRRCTIGGHFQRAKDEDAFPVRFFWDFRPTTPRVLSVSSREGLNNIHVPGHPDAALAALLDYTSGFYAAGREAGMRASLIVDAMHHVESAARHLHRLALDAACITPPTGAAHAEG